MIDIRPLTDTDQDWSVRVQAESWSEPVVARLGELIDPTQLPGFVAWLDGERAGLATYAIRGDACELVTIQSLREGRGMGAPYSTPCTTRRSRPAVRGSG